MNTTSENEFSDWTEELSFSSLSLRKELLGSLLSLNYHHMTPISEVQGAGYKELSIGQRVSYTLKKGEQGEFATQVYLVD